MGVVQPVVADKVVHLGSWDNGEYSQQVDQATRTAGLFRTLSLHQPEPSVIQTDYTKKEDRKGGEVDCEEVGTGARLRI
jgi:hypothetical protein